MSYVSHFLHPFCQFFLCFHKILTSITYECRIPLAAVSKLSHLFLWFKVFLEPFVFHSYWGELGCTECCLGCALEMESEKGWICKSERIVSAGWDCELLNYYAVYIYIYSRYACFGFNTNDFLHHCPSDVENMDPLDRYSSKWWHCGPSFYTKVKLKKNHV